MLAASLISGGGNWRWDGPEKTRLFQAFKVSTGHNSTCEQTWALAFDYLGIYYNINIMNIQTVQAWTASIMNTSFASSIAPCHERVRVFDQGP